MLVALHRSEVLGVLHACQCVYCATKSPGDCGLDWDGCTSDFTGLTAQERLDNAAGLV